LPTRIRLLRNTATDNVRQDQAAQHMLSTGARGATLEDVSVEASLVHHIPSSVPHAVLGILGATP
jgi:hypothetical protein